LNEPGPNESANQYERPNQPWVCGLAAAGHACAAGPTARGRCPALAECAPKRDGDRWQCNRSVLRGGPCDQGPTPEGRCGRIQKCRPERSLRSKRRRFIAACAIVTLAAVMIALGSGWRERAIRPGPLAQQHAQLLENADGRSPSCGACHAAATQNVAGWAASLVAASDSLPTQSQLCMNCHSKSISKDLALMPHNVTPQILQEFQGRRREMRSRSAETVHSPAVSAGSVTQVSTGGSDVRSDLDAAPTRDGSAIYGSVDTQIACAACHREHHGARADLTLVADDACQACHEQRYRSFAADHPDFGVWPYVRRTRIAFNHASHRGKHFAEKKQTFDCRTCHATDVSGAVERTASYETACASCHDEKIATSVGRGVPMFTLPIMDVDALKAAGHDIGPWPEAAIGDFDGRLPAATKLLLAGDPNGAEALATLGTSFEFQDVDPGDKEQLAASAKLAAAIKSLVNDVCARAPVAVRERLSIALGRELTDAEVAMLTGGLSPDTMRVVASWVQEPVKDQATTSPTQTLIKVKAPYGPAGTWSQDAATFAIRYRPAVHADPVLAAWIELLANTPHVEQRPVAIALFKELTKSTAPGLCASCHSVEQSGAGALAVNWRAHDRSTTPHGFTKFTHEPHLTLPQLADCTTCHAVDDGAIAATAYVDADPRHFVCDFKPMTKQQCSECHTRTAAGDSCQSCHNYHVDAVEAWRLAAPKNGQKLQARRVGTAHR
jgi:hypothetical protein